jgi:hypothetical protein
MYTLKAMTRGGVEALAVYAELADAIATADLQQARLGESFDPRYATTGASRGRSYEVYDGTALIYRADGYRAGVTWRADVARLVGWMK